MHFGFGLCQKSDYIGICKYILPHQPIHWHLLRLFYLESSIWVLCTFVHLHLSWNQVYRSLVMTDSTVLWGGPLGVLQMQAVPSSGLWLCHKKQIVDSLPAASCHLQFVLSTKIALFWTSQSPHCGEEVVCLLNVLFTIWLAAKHRTYLWTSNARDHHIPVLKRSLASPYAWLAPAIPHTGPVLFLWGFGKEGSVLSSSSRRFLSFEPSMRGASRHFLRRGAFRHLISSAFLKPTWVSRKAPFMGLRKSVTVLLLSVGAQSMWLPFPPLHQPDSLLWKGGI